MNPTNTLYASGTRRTGSPTGLATRSTTTLARNAQVACLRTNVMSIPDLSICAYFVSGANSLLVDTFTKWQIVASSLVF